MNPAARAAGEVRVTTLDNGIRVVTDRMPAVETVSLGAWFHVGTRHEPADRNGVAHLLEHMAFKGTRRRSATAIAEEIEAVGGHLNAYTAREQTAYYAKVLKPDLPLAVEMLADILTESVFDEAELARERAVVVQEIGQAADTPDDLVFDLFQETAFPDQPMGRPVLGRAGVVAAMPRDAILDFVRAGYGGEAAVFAAAGNLDHDELVARVADGFAGLPRQCRARTETARYEGGERRQPRDLEQAHLVIGFRGPSFHHPDFYAAQIFSMLFGGGMSSRLFQELRERRGLVYSVYSFCAAYADDGLFGIYAGTGAEDVAELVPVIGAELHKAAESIGEAEVQRAGTQLKSGLLMSREATTNRCEQAAQHMLVHGRVLPVDELVARIDAVDPAAIRHAVIRMLRQKPTLTAVGPLERLEDYDRFRARLRL